MKREQMKVAVIDGQGGGVGRALVEQIKKAYPDLHVRALGTNSAATAAMLRAGATDAATGENAIIYNASRMQVILGPVAILVGNGLLGEITPANEFYDYEAKYENAASELHIPARISQDLSYQVRDIAVKAFKALDCAGLSRVDFFVTPAQEIYLNELNTMPGFTSISMYPKLFISSGMTYAQLLDRLIELGIRRNKSHAESLRQNW